MSTTQRRGMSVMPDFVRSALSSTTIAELSADGFGITFPDEHGCQTRLVFNKECDSRYYAYSQYGSIEKAIRAAISRQRQLRVANSFKPVEKQYVCFSERYDTRRGRTEYSYKATYRKPDGKYAAKTFYLGTEYPSAAKAFHAYMNARLFRFYFEELGNNFNMAMFDSWRHSRLYMKGNPFVNWSEL